MKKALIISLLFLSNFAFASGFVCRAGLDERRILDPARGEINFRVLGRQHQETLILLHGMGGSMLSWHLVAPFLAEQGYKVIVLDLRGHGGSLEVGEDYTTGTMAADVKNLLEYLHIPKATVVGHSMGARVAAKFATLYPQMTERLIIEDMDLIQRTNATPERQRRVILKAREVARVLDSHAYTSRDTLSRALSPFFVQPDLVGHMERAVQRPDGSWTIERPFRPDTYLLYWNQANTDRNLLQDLAQTRIPTLILRADIRKFWSAMTNGGAELTRRYFPEAHLVGIRNADHSIHETQPRAYLETVLSFFNAYPLRGQR